MKKQLLLLILILLPMVSSADAVEIDGIYYNLISKNGTNVAEVTSNPNRYTGSVIIPELVNYGDKDYSVTGIGNSAFEACPDLTSIIIPNSVTIIRSGAFDGCSGLTTITIPSGVTSIGGSAFCGCTNLIDIIIPNNVASIGSWAFAGCSSLASITIPNSLTLIEEDAFRDCYGLNKVIIQDIAAWCGITFENYGSNPAYNAHHIYSDETTEIKEIIIPYSVSSIGNYAFSGCTNLTSVTIPTSVTYIGGSVFQDCTNLTDVTIPNGITRIEGSTFFGCSSLSSVTLPTSVTYIGGNAFRDCTSLANITIPDNVTRISKQAFGGCISLTSITVPNSVTDLDGYVFNGCSNLSSITIGSGIMEIRSCTFGNCPELADVYCLAENVPNTASNAFDGSYIELATLHVPATSVDAYKSAEPWKNFKEITYIEGTGPVVIDGLKYDIEDDWAVVVGRDGDYHDVVIPDKVTYKDKEYKVRVEQGSYNGRRGAFCEDEGIYSYTDPYITGTYYSASGGMCYHAINLKKISCSSLTSIEGGWVTATYHTAFAECSSLEEVDMPNLQRIGDIAFVGCNSLKDIDFPKLQHVEDCAFRGTSLQSINLPELLKACTMAFANCSSLKTIVVDKVEFLGTKQHSTSSIGGTFLNCTSLKEVVLPNIINIISSSDNKWDDVYGNFEGCTSLEKVELGNKCEMIDKSTFKGCTSLSQIYSHSITPPTLEPSAFDESTYSSATLMVHASALNDYKSTYPWSLFKKITTIEPIYRLTYIVDDNIYKEEEIAEGMIITPEPEPTKEGYTFSGWSEIPATMPAHDVIITGSFTVNQYTITYIIDNEVYTTQTVDYGSTIVPPTIPEREGYDFAWGDYPETMPAYDITIYGTYMTGIEAIMAGEANCQIFSLDGKQLNEPHKGINIVRMSNGQVRKIVK